MKSCCTKTIKGFPSQWCGRYVVRYWLVSSCLCQSVPLWRPCCWLYTANLFILHDLEVDLNVKAIKAFLSGGLWPDHHLPHHYLFWASSFIFFKTAGTRLIDFSLMAFPFCNCGSLESFHQVFDSLGCIIGLGSLWTTGPAQSCSGDCSSAFMFMRVRLCGSQPWYKQFPLFLIFGSTAQSWKISPLGHRWPEWKS